MRDIEGYRRIGQEIRRLGLCFARLFSGRLQALVEVGFCLKCLAMTV